jgi:membrane-associated phospholipid phosphatase
MDLPDTFKNAKPSCLTVPKAELQTPRFKLAMAFAVLYLSLGTCVRAQEQADFAPLCDNTDGPATHQGDTAARPASEFRGFTMTALPGEAPSCKLPGHFLRGQKDIWLFEVKSGESYEWPRASFVEGGTTASMKEDPPVERKVRQTDTFNEYVTLPPVTFEREATEEDSGEQGATSGSSQPPSQTQQANHEGLVMRSVKRTLEDQKELYLSPFKPSNFKWDALELVGTAALLASDRDIEKHIGNAHVTLYQATSDVAIAGLGATLAGVWAWGIKGDHPHAKETGELELETLVNTFLIYTPMQLLAARQRPDVGNGNGDFWKNHAINTSFPGGHAMFTFAMATVVSHEYRQKWVQVLAYSAASIVTVSRFQARDHWASDMFIGSALGIGIGAHVFHAHCDPQLSDSCKHHVRWIF